MNHMMNPNNPAIPRVSIKKQKKCVKPNIIEVKKASLHIKWNKLTLQTELQQQTTQLQQQTTELQQPTTINTPRLLKLYKHLRKHSRKKTLIPILKEFIINNLSAIVENAFRYHQESLEIVKKTTQLIVNCTCPQMVSTGLPENNEEKILGQLQNAIDVNMTKYIERTLHLHNYRDKYHKIYDQLFDFEDFLWENFDFYYQQIFQDEVYKHVYEYIRADITNLTIDNFPQIIKPLLKVIFHTHSLTGRQLHAGFLFYKLQELNINPALCDVTGLDTGPYIIVDPVALSQANPDMWLLFHSKEGFMKTYVEGLPSENNTIESSIMASSTHSESMEIDDTYYSSPCSNASTDRSSLNHSQHSSLSDNMDL